MEGNSRRTSIDSRTPTVIEEREASIQSHVERSSQVEKPDQFLVLFDDNDPENPQNWSRAKKWYLTMLGGVLVLNATFASSAPSGIVGQLMEDFQFGREVATLTISLFVAGYCVGPLVWGPISETYGRRPVFVVSFFVYTCFQVGCALSPNTAALIIFRFLGGTFAAAPLTNSGALISDIWDARTRGKALAMFTLAPFAGPSLGPTVAGYMNVAGLSWRWVFWVLTIFAGCCFVLIVFTIPETYAPVILRSKAERLRKSTGDDKYYALIETQKISFAKRLEHIVARPFRILFTEPMLLAVTIYMSFIYGCVYLLFEAYPIVFTEGHNFNTGALGLMFLPILVGGVVAVLCNLFIFNPRYEREMARRSPQPVDPEFRLEMACGAAPIFTIAFFWFGWTSYPEISFWAPMMAGGLMGFSICWLFMSLFNYIIDAYLFVAASALAGNTVVRSIFGAVFPLFATQMYEALGPQWASSLVGFVALAMVPIPFALMKYGPTLRLKSKYAPTKPHVPKTESVDPEKVEDSPA
ncbi:major facilitator superfamily domain-containing protein [Schizophyllum amplum]|uniref:Major facilitator superfamily domain-containing protein n=1 Tax=Schizophyllum amplum TaxID=97359 RepID=A0A550CNW8_9AGAR|nr:major facilitator superfamily domain-containing protein [Auriculariopsis ampla]